MTKEKHTLVLDLDVDDAIKKIQNFIVKVRELRELATQLGIEWKPKVPKYTHVRILDSDGEHVVKDKASMEKYGEKVLVVDFRKE